MRYLITFFLALSALTAFSQGAVDRIELGYQTTKRGIVWVRPGLPTHEPAWRISRDTNSIMWHNLTTGIRYDWSYDAGVWYTRDFIASTLPPLDVFTSGAATIDNTQATWINDDGVLHHYSQAEGAWLPDKISFQSAGPTDIAAGVSNGAAVYTTSLWQDSDTYLVYYWDGDSWELLSGSGTNLTYSGTSSPVTLNSSTGTDVTVTAGTGISLAASSTNMTITNSAPDQTVSITNGGGVSVSGTYPNFTLTATDASATNEAQTLSVSGTTSGIISLDAISGVGGGSATIAAGTNIGVSQSGGTITINNTGAAALSGVTNQIPYFNTTSTITTEAGSGVNSLTWDATNNRIGIRDAAPSADFTMSNSNSASTGGIRLYEGTDAATYWNIWTGGSGNYDGYLNFTQNGQFIMNMHASGTQFFKGLYMNENNNTSISGVYIRPIQHGNSYISFERLAANPTDGILKMAAWGHLNFITGSNSNAANVDVNGQWGINMANGSQTRNLDVNGEVRIRDLTTTTPTLLVSADANGVLSTAGLSGLSFSSGTLTATDGSTTNELQTISAGGAGPTSYTIDLSNSGGSVTLSEGTGIDLSRSTNTITVANSAPDQTVSITGAGITNVTGTYPNFTITSTEVDGSISNEGSLTVGAGSGTTSIINSNTSGSTGVTITAGTGLTISETGNVITLANSAPDQTVSITNGGGISVSGTYPSFTLTATDQSATNEAQTLSVSGTTSGILSLNAISGVGGGTATIAAGTGITVGQSGGTITITNSSPATAGWLLDGNTITAAKRIGSNDNFDVVVETNNTDRLWIDNAGTVSIGATQLTTAALNINGLQTGTGMLIAGGGSLVGPNFYTATGSGTGSTATVLSGVLSMISGNVEALLKNTATTGTGGGSVITLNVSPTATSNDPFIKWQTEATTDWSMGMDNDDIDNLKLHRFSRPSDNNGQGTVEFGYRTNDIGIAVNKTGIGTGTNGFYGVDVGGKVRADQFANNSSVLNGATVATIALGDAAGTSPTLDNTTTSVWGNGARLRFTSGSSPTANGVICTITLDTQYTFSECASGIFARSTNASGFGYSSSFNSATRVITFTLNGTLTASTVYEFNIIFNGKN